MQDMLFIGIVLLSFAMIVLIGFKLATEFNTQIQADANMPAMSKSNSAEVLGYYTSSIDNAFLFLTIGLSLATLVLAALVRVHPVFIVFFIIGLIFLIFVSGILSNMYDEMATNPQLSAQANQLTFISFVMTRLPFVIGVMGIVLMLVLYKVWRTD